VSGKASRLRKQLGIVGCLEFRLGTEYQIEYKIRGLCKGLNINCVQQFTD
jgi:hypothetical protein